MTTLETPTTPDTEAKTQCQPLAYPEGVYTCPVTGVEIPKPDKAHREWRADVLMSAKHSRKSQDYLREVASHSLIVFINLFGWTYLFKKINKSGKEVAPPTAHVPFNTWPCQDTALEQLAACVPTSPDDEGSDVLIDKSRDMGASWLIVELVAWLWLFCPDSRCVLASRIEDEIDKRGSPRSIFWKIEYQVGKLPEWLLPVSERSQLDRGGAYRQYMQLTNPANGATISGTASTEHIGRGDRANLVAFDEFAAMEHAEEAWEAAADTTPCRIANSTPIGAGTKYSRLYFEGVKSGTPKVVGLYYHDHPEKGRGRELRTDENVDITGEAGERYYWTPWLSQEIPRRTPLYLAQNIFAKHTTSGITIFNTAAITRHMRNHTEEPKRCEMVVDEDASGREVAWFRHAPNNGRWYLWCDLDRNGRPANQQTNYVIFADPAYGNGQANAAVNVLDRETGKIVAEYVDPYTPPQDLSWEMGRAGRYLFRGQAKSALVGWETNGPGESMFWDFQRMDYPFVYYQKQLGYAGDRQTRRYGWNSTDTKKEMLCAELDKALVNDQIHIPSHATLSEMLEYTFDENGRIGPGHLHDEKTGAKKAHGDRVIAAAGCVMLRREAPRFHPEPEPYRPEQLGAIAEHWRIEGGEDDDVPTRHWR